ncbi:MAG: hypothetical protein ACNA7T_08480, partial [Haliea sp.]
MHALPAPFAAIIDERRRGLNADRVCCYNPALTPFTSNSRNHPAMPALTDTDIQDTVRAALAEDIGSGDITAALIPASTHASARVITREDGILCGRAWVDAVFRQVDPGVTLEWSVEDGAHILANSTLFTA